MDAFTAGSSLVISKFSVAVVMTGIYCFMPHEKCTRDWALAAVLVASGALAAILNAGEPRFAVLLLANTAVVLGMIMQWRGIRSFYKKPSGYLGWIIGALFFAALVWLLSFNAPVVKRAILIAATVLALLILNAYEFAAGHRAHPSFGSRLAVGSALFLVLCFVVNVTAPVMNIADISHTTTSPLAIATLYLIPVIGSLLLTTGMVVLLFERVTNAPTNR
jgi:hypothetical protein